MSGLLGGGGGDPGGDGSGGVGVEGGVCKSNLRGGERVRVEWVNLAGKREDLNYVLLGIKLWIRGKVHVADLFGVMMVMMLGVNCLFLEMQVVGGHLCGG